MLVQSYEDGEKIVAKEIIDYGVEHCFVVVNDW